MGMTEQALTYLVGRLIAENERLRNRIEAIAEAAFDIECWLHTLHDCGNIGWQPYHMMLDLLDCMEKEETE